MYRYLGKNGKPVKTRGAAARDKLGRYWFEVFARVDGKQLRRRFWLASEADVAHEEEALKRGVSARLLKWSEAFKAWRDSGNRTAEYIENAERNINSLIRRYGDKAVAETTLAEFVAWTTGEAKERGGRTGQTCHTHALSVAHWAQSIGLIPPDALLFEHARKPAYKPNPRRPFTPDELPVYGQRLSPEALPVYLFLALSGVRASEACGLSLDGIDAGATVAEFMQKGGELRRLPLDNALRAVLDMAKAVRDKCGCKRGTVFVTANGLPWTRYSFRSHCNARWKGLPHHKPHELRHGFGTVADTRFVPDAIRAGMGHATREASESYIHADELTAAEVGGSVRATLLQHLGTILPEIDRPEPVAPVKIKCPHCNTEFIVN